MTKLVNINSDKKILLTGSNGLLGNKLVGQLLEIDARFLATSNGENTNPNCPDKNYLELDITDKQSVLEVLNNYQPDVIINTAAMTNVDACESLPDECFKVNVDGFKNLFDWSASNDAHVIQISTDFIFDGENGPYKEEDLPNPLSEYGRSKLESEKVCFNSSYKNWTILRTIVVYGTAPNLKRSNIVLWARETLKNEKSINIVDDQFRAPTWADDLAMACLLSIEKKVKGVFHISGPETMSIFDIVNKIADFYNIDKRLIKPIKTDELGQVASRPPKTGFKLDKARKELGYSPKTFEETLGLLENELESNN